MPWEDSVDLGAVPRAALRQRPLCQLLRFEHHSGHRGSRPNVLSTSWGPSENTPHSFHGCSKGGTFTFLGGSKASPSQACKSGNYYQELSRAMAGIASSTP